MVEEGDLRLRLEYIDSTKLSIISPILVWNRSWHIITWVVTIKRTVVLVGIFLVLSIANKSFICLKTYLPCNIILQLIKLRRFFYWIIVVVEKKQKYNSILFADRFYLHQGKFSGDLVTFPQIYIYKSSYNCFVLVVAKSASFQDLTHLRYELCVRVYAGNRKEADYLWDIFL